ncbi:hypothetical protein FB45DRAFT_1057235 [Roridomyces roridus]|uniref:Uncharacterized protein n=1 Tax=Roridomyces roridus TaxID=1738132 RepID=A0AAD7C0E0_9AGAR|nr:hypothetical protein FB45DRAFT_1057235 [Roridomyces roridus]
MFFSRRSDLGEVHPQGGIEQRATASISSSVDSLLKSDEAQRDSQYATSRRIQVLSWILHVSLVVLHLLLIAIWATGLEHRFTVPLAHQKLASFLITSSTTAFGTIYSALLVFVTQTLFIRRSLRMEQMLTTTHDNAAAWAGIGAAILHLWHQRTVGPARTSSFLGLSSIALYLTAILGFHITISSVFSLVTFSATQHSVASTLSLPTYDGDFGAGSFGPVFDNGTLDFGKYVQMQTYAVGSMYSLPSNMNSTTRPGLSQGSLYDVLESPITGTAAVDATGFDVTCKYLPGVNFTHFNDTQTWAYGGFFITPTQPRLITQVQNWVDDNTVAFYSTIPILDSDGETGPMVPLDPPMNNSVSSVQVFTCSLSLVDQTASIDAQSQQLRSLTPDFAKSASTWSPQPNASTPTNSSNPFINMWALWVKAIPASSFPLDLTENIDLFNLGNAMMASLADIYLYQALILPSGNASSIRLHDLENALSNVVASVFWTIGHNPMTAASMYSPFDNDLDALSQTFQPPILLQGSAQVTEVYQAERLELNIVAVSLGLATSVLLLTLTLPALLSRHLNSDSDGGHKAIGGTGLLHAIWLYRNHPELEKLLDQVDNPTDENLRAAGMVRTRLVDGKGNQWDADL